MITRTKHVFPSLANRFGVISVIFGALLLVLSQLTSVSEVVVGKSHGMSPSVSVHRRCFITNNFFSYEQPHSYPEGLPADFTTFYVTDNVSYAKMALELGFDFSILDTTPALSLQFSIDTDLDESFANIAGAQRVNSGMMCRARYAPHVYYAEIRRQRCEQVWFMDANVKEINTSYFEKFFFGAADPSKALYVDVGYYDLPRNIVAELHHSVVQDRWAEYAAGMKNASLRYYLELDHRFGPEKKSSCRVASAKFTGMNLEHPMLPFISEWLMEQCKVNYQGNIVLSHLACMLNSSVQSLTALKDVPGLVELRAHGS